ncbi:hypothetical protein PVK06_013923 [Gossypium arboreum]|uniref:peptidyl-tRNA hydrolase n=1 Tax=Gossypium arboreum TaxID=29729 RepID=A0ABR0PTH2_GOSAR|nr:hypothetical protein PVK06_013923 [Gossypium arboreum]
MYIVICIRLQQLLKSKDGMMFFTLLLQLASSFTQYSWLFHFPHTTSLRPIQSIFSKIMWAPTRNSSQPSNKKLQKQGSALLGVSFKPENFIPGLVIGFILGLFLDLSKPTKTLSKKKNFLTGKLRELDLVSSNADQDLKMVLVVRQDLKMKAGKIASQCAHAATGIYAELMHSDRSLLREWEDCGQPKIVVSCRNQQEM